MVVEINTQGALCAPYGGVVCCDLVLFGTWTGGSDLKHLNIRRTGLGGSVYGEPSDVDKLSRVNLPSFNDFGAPSF